MSTRKRRKISSLYFFVLYYKTNIKLFSVLIYSYINTRGNWENSKLFGNTPPFGRRVSTQFLVLPISIRVDITVYQHGKCFVFVKCQIDIHGQFKTYLKVKTPKYSLQTNSKNYPD
jgi:hypothetical protein